MNRETEHKIWLKVVYISVILAILFSVLSTVIFELGYLILLCLVILLVSGIESQKIYRW